MQILSIIENHQVKFNHAFGYILRSCPESITINDQEKACGQSWSAYRFAQLNIPGTDINKCQEAACKDPEYAYYFARDILGADIKYCQEHACKRPSLAYLFARDIPGANIEYCHKYACKKTVYALWFAQDVPGADIEYCRKACEHDEYWLNAFDKMIAKKKFKV